MSIKKPIFKALFVHIPKCGGSSISKAPWIVLHGSYKVSPRLVKIDSLKTIFSFTRNPYTRFTSGVFNHGHADSAESFDKFLDEFEADPDKYTNTKDQVLRQQAPYLFFDGKLAVNYVGRLESIEEDWLQLCEIVGEKFDIPHVNKNKYPEHTKYLTERAKKIVQKVYNDDFELLGYEK